MSLEDTKKLHFGGDELHLDPARSVFINCPFDVEYAASFDAIVFATACCGFMPRCALETGSVSEPRLDRITSALFNSKYSIHDLSRCTGEGVENLARFNMPLELGMAMARRLMDNAAHDWGVLVPHGHTHLKYISDMAAYDLLTHDGSPQGLVVAVIGWLTTRKDANVAVTPYEVLTAFPGFQSARLDLERKWHGPPPWFRIVEVAKKMAELIV